jgi:hypothetical protein
MDSDCLARGSLQSSPDMDTQQTCHGLNSDGIGSLLAESPILCDDVQDEVMTPQDLGNTDPAVSDAVLDCDCHVSVY